MFHVGHNDVGYQPDRQPLEVGDISTAIAVLCNEAIQWFSPLMQGDEPEMTDAELNKILSKIRALRQKSKLMAQGHVFWIQ